MISSNTMLQEFGFALSVAILLDAMVVRTYIVPAAMVLWLVIVTVVGS